MALLLFTAQIRPSVLALALTLTVFHISTLIPCQGLFSNHHVVVNITNRLGPGTALSLHCKSKDDDLGPKVLNREGDSWSFRFRPNVLGLTLFFCSAKWAGLAPAPVYVDIYKEVRDDCRFCCWNIRPTGPCLHYCDKPGSYVCFKWRKPGEAPAPGLMD